MYEVRLEVRMIASAVISSLALAGASAPRCATPSDCSLNGACVDEACVCRAAFQGAQCDQLALLPARSPSSGYRSVNISSWGGSVLYSADDGLWHMWASEMVHHCGLDAWQSNSRIIHATSSEADGNYNYSDEVVSVFAHNPTVVRGDRGEYVMIFEHSSPPPCNFTTCSSCTNGTTTQACNSRHAQAPCDPYKTRYPSYLSWATQPNGPWSTPEMIPVFRDTGNQGDFNVSPVIFGNGSLLLLYRYGGYTPGGVYESFLHVGRAAHWRDVASYTIDNSTDLFPGLPTGGFEDPFLYRDCEGAFHAVVHSMVGEATCHRLGDPSGKGSCGAHIFSKDGVNWQTHAFSGTYNGSIAFAGGAGAGLIATRRERPHLLFRKEDAKDCGDGILFPCGDPIMLSTSVMHGLRDASFTQLQPLRVAKVIPAAQTPVQLRAMAELTTAARAASDAATSAMEMFLNSTNVRKQLRIDAPHLNSLSPAAIAARWRSEAAVAEVVHGFHARFNATGNNALDFDITLASEVDFFCNQWQIPILYPERANMTYESLCAFLAPAAANEINLWKLPKFSAPIPRDPSPTPPLWPGGYPANLSEASNRAVYAALNQHRIDFPAYYWGDVAVVFNRSFVDPMVVYTPFDSGDYTCDCDISFTSHYCAAWASESACGAFWYCEWSQEGEIGSCTAKKDTHTSHNCSAWSSGISGVVDAVDHMILPFATWEDDAAERVSAMIGRATQSWSSPTLKNMTTGLFGFDWYFEADLLGNVPFPTGVKFLLAEFGANFGSDNGVRVREWAMKWGWPLIWALGPNVDGPDTAAPPSWRATGRLIDPIVLLRSAAGANLSAVATSATPRFNATWDAVRTARRDTTWDTKTTLHWWQILTKDAPRDLAVEPLMAGSCVDAGRCVGVDADGSCVCYN